jgi:hypothetical protein
MHTIIKDHLYQRVLPAYRQQQEEGMCQSKRWTISLFVIYFPNFHTNFILLQFMRIQ